MSSRRTRRQRSARDSHQQQGDDLSGFSDEAAADEIFGDAPASFTSKLDQLCVQVGEAIAMALATASDGLLRELGVVSVAVGRGAANLRVTLAAPRGEVDLDAILARLQRAAGYLRSEVAGSVHRRRVPDLSYVVVAADDANGDRDGDTGGDGDGDGDGDGEVGP
jgi:ribosome-binding factor A